MNQNIPNSGQKTVTAVMKIQSFVSQATPDQKQMEQYDATVNAFLATIDNNKRFLNGRNSYSVGDKIVTLVWYLERIEDKPVTTPFGNQNDKATPTEETKA